MISDLRQSIENLRRGVTGPPRKSQTDPLTPRPMNQGGTADVFEKGAGTVLKLFHDSIPDDRVDDEYEATKFAHEAGLPVPRPGEKVDVDGRRGITFERVGGEPLWNLLFRRPWILARRSQSGFVRTLTWPDSRCARTTRNEVHARLHGQLDRSSDDSLSQALS